MRGRRTIVLCALVLTLGAGCVRGQDPVPPPGPSTGPSASPTATLPPVGVACRDLATQGRTLRLENQAGREIAAVDLGEGQRGVVLAHQSDADMCQWLPYATLLAGQGYRVVVFDFAGFGTSSKTQTPTYIDDIRTVVGYLHEQNTPKVVVIGASMGATMSIVAGAAPNLPVAGVVAISPPKVFDSINAERAAPNLRVPALYIAGDEDGDYSVYAREIEDATPEELRELLVVSAPEHGVALVEAQTPAGAAVRAAIAEFLAAHLNPATSVTPSK